jgi:hypothetical protein
MNTARGDGGLCGSAIDLARWARLLARGEAVDADGFARMSAPTPTAGGPVAPYGMGLALLSLDGRPRVSHTGAIGGFSSALAYYPRDDLAIAVLTNLGGFPVEAVEQAVARAMLGLPPPPVRDLAVPDETRRRLIGRWEIGIPGFVIEVADAGNRVKVRMPAPGWSGALRYQGEGRFAPTLTVLMGDMHWTAHRRRPLRADRTRRPTPGRRQRAAPHRHVASPLSATGFSPANASALIDCKSPPGAAANVCSTSRSAGAAVETPSSMRVAHPPRRSST